LIPVTGLAQQWQSLFNGKDLTGWRANFDPESFTVRDGTIRIQASGAKSAHLFFVGDQPGDFEKFKNFELEATVRAEPSSNGGIFVHCDHELRDAARHLAKGYEVQLNSTDKEQRKTGSLYAVVDLPQSPVDETQWFQVDVLVQDKRIIVKLNGQQVVDYTEPENVERPPERAGRRFSADGGAIALQAHDNGSVWYFKEIRVRRLP
jgi:hypothetical protein